MKNIVLEIRSKTSPYAVLYLVDNLISLSWTSSFQEPGYSQFVCSVTPAELQYFKIQNLVIRGDLDQVHYITRVEISRDINGLLYVTCDCMDILNMMNQRIILNQIQHTGVLNAYLNKIIKQNVTEPTDANRKIPLFSTTLSVSSGITSTISVQTRWDQVLDKLVDIMKQYNIGIRAGLLSNNTAIAKIFVYRVKDQTIGNTASNPVAIFSDDLGNLNSWSYSQDISNYKNIAVVAGEGEGTARLYSTAGAAFNEARYEMYVDARDLSYADTPSPQDENYRILLESRGFEDLAEYKVMYDAVTEANAQVYQARVDYDIGSLVSVRTEAFSAKALVTQITEIYDSTGYSIFPTLTVTTLE